METLGGVGDHIKRQSQAEGRTEAHGGGGRFPMARRWGPAGPREPWGRAPAPGLGAGIVCAADEADCLFLRTYPVPITHKTTALWAEIFLRNGNESNRDKHA